MQSQATFAEAYGKQPTNPAKGSWLQRVSHRASHIPNRPLNTPPGSKDTLPLRTPNSAGAASGFHEQLSFPPRTSSYPTSPTSPTETVFGATPIDPNFGDRVDSPPRRPAPERPSLQVQDRTAGLPSQRSRSGTLNQASEESMDKYARQAGDSTYDSDAEADDEFERSVFTSPTMPGHLDDDTDHPSDSEDEQESVDGEYTPTTQGWTEKEGRSPTGKVTQWTEEEVADYICSLATALKQYGLRLVEEGINGEALVALHHEELQEIGVASFGHRLTILKAVYEQKVRAGVKIEEGDYVPLSAEEDRSDMAATQDDITRIIESLRLRDQRIIAAEAELRVMKRDLDRISDENRKLREDTLPAMRLMKDQRTPLPDPAGGTMHSPRENEFTKPPETATNQKQGSSLGRKLSTKIFSNSKQPSPTYPPQAPLTSREVRDDGGVHLEASAAAMAASSHLTASMTSQTSPNSVHTSQLSPTSPAYSAQAPSSGGSYQPPGSAATRSFPQSSRHDQRTYGHTDDADNRSSYNTNHWSQASTIVAAEPQSARNPDFRRRQVPAPSPREEEPRDKDRDRDKDNPQVEIFKSFRVSIEDPCRLVLPVALKRYNITDDWRQYALYIVHGDQERCLGLEEKPLLLFKQLDKEGRKPMFMLRRHASPQEGWTNVTGGGGHSQDRTSAQIPGGVL